jgi:hypothetical protein
MIGRLMHFWNEEHGLTALLILLVFDVFIMVPLSRTGHQSGLIAGIVFSLLLLAGLLTMARYRTFQVVSGVFVISTIVVRLARSVIGVSGLFQWDALLSILCIVSMLIVVLWQLNRQGPVTGHRIRGAVAAYLLIAILFAYGYTFIDSVFPGSFQLPAWVSQTLPEHTEAFLYFSMVALTTTGFGDITGVHPFAHSLVMFEVLIGQLYPAILIARLVTLEMETRRSGKG